MSDIERNLEAILSATHGRDVRQAIHDSIHDCYEDGRAGSTDLVAREQYSTLVADLGGNRDETELWTGSAYLPETELNLSEAFDSFDYLDIYFSASTSSNTFEVKRIKPTVGEVYTFNFFNVVDTATTYGFVNDQEIELEMTSTEKITISFAQSWAWDGSSAANAVKTAYTSSSEGVAYVRKVVGIKYTTDTEVADIRIGEDGTTYTSAGEAVRTQISDLKSAIGNLNNLDTDVKTDLVSAINEVMGSGGSSVPTSVRQALQTLLESALYKYDGLTDEKAIIASWATEVTDLIINQSSIAIVGDDTYQLTATTIPSGALVSWYSSDANVASVSQTGLVKGVGNGNCVITASSGDMRVMCSVGVSGFVMYSVTNSLTKVSTDNNATEVARGSAYSANLTVFEGYDLDSVTVTMGGTDITSTAYSDGVVSIASVTGDLVITAVATYTPVPITVTMPSVKDASYEGRRFSGAELEPSGTYANACISYYLSVLPSSTLSVSGMDYHNMSGTDVVFYNYAKDTVVGSGNMAYGSWSWTVPEGAYWARINMGITDQHTVTYTPYEI